MKKKLSIELRNVNNTKKKKEIQSGSLNTCISYIFYQKVFCFLDQILAIFSEF